MKIVSPWIDQTRLFKRGIALSIDKSWFSGSVLGIKPIALSTGERFIRWIALSTFVTTGPRTLIWVSTLSRGYSVVVCWGLSETVGRRWKLLSKTVLPLSEVTIKAVHHKWYKMLLSEFFLHRRARESLLVREDLMKSRQAERLAKQKLMEFTSSPDLFSVSKTCHVWNLRRTGHWPHALGFLGLVN